MSIPSPSAEFDDHGRRRWWRVGQNAGAQLFARVVSGLCQLALVRLMLGQLGVDSFGWTMALVALVGLSQFADLGVAMALQQALSEAWARNDEAALRRTYASGARLLAWIALGWLVVGLPLAWTCGDRLLPAPPGDFAAAKACWLAVVVTMTVGIPLSAGFRLAVALQLGWIAALWTAAVNVAMLAVAWALTKPTFHAGPLAFVVLLGAGQSVPGLMCAVHLPRRLKWHGRIAGSTDEVGRLWRAALPFASQNLAGALLQGAAPWAFARFGGYAANAAFAILQRLFGLVQQGHALLLSPLWPAYAEAQVRGDARWVSRVFRFSLLITLPVTVGVLVLAAALPLILRVWLGAQASIPPPLLTWSITVWVVTAIMGQPLVLLLLGLGRFQRMAVPVTAIHLLTLVAMAVFGAHWGGAGVALALAGGLTLGVLPLYVYESALALRALPRTESTVTPSAARF